MNAEMEEDVRKLHDFWQAHLEAKLFKPDGGVAEKRVLEFLDTLSVKYASLDQAKSIIDKVFLDLIEQYNLAARA